MFLKGKYNLLAVVTAMGNTLLLLGIAALSVSTLLAKRGYGFIENKNQWPASIHYMASIPGGKMAIQAGRFSYYFFNYDKMNALHYGRHYTTFKETKTAGDRKSPVHARHIRVDFLNSNPLSKPSPSKKSSTYFNYFLGKDPQRWASKAHAFDEITYRDFYPGIDLLLSRVDESIKYDLVVSAGADPGCISMEYAGMVSLSLFDGDLMVDATPGHIIEKKPISYQIIDGVKKYVPTAYRLVGNRVYFTFPKGYDPGYELVIDPLLIFSTYSGFTADNWGSSATPGEGGTLYSSGVTTESLGGFFGVTPGAFQTTFAGGEYDVGILKYDSLGKKLLYASYLGGRAIESSHSLLLNHNQDLLVLGTTSSSNFPVTANAYDASFGGGTDTVGFTPVLYSTGVDIFLAKLSKDGSKLLASTYLGGSHNDGINSALSANYGDALRGDITVDSKDNVFIASVSSSRDFGVLNSFDTTYAGGKTDALIAKLSTNLDTLHWAAFLGGEAAEAAYSIKLDKTQDTLFVAGATSSANFPTTQGVYNADYPDSASANGWIAKLTSDGTLLKAATLVGKGAYNQVYFIDLNSNGDVYVYGQKLGDFPITAGTYSNPNSGQFLQKYTADLSSLLYSTTFGSGRGGIDISPTAFSINSQCGNVYMAGWGGGVNIEQFHQRSLGRFVQHSSTKGMPVTPDALQRNTQGSDFYFAVLNEDASELLYATFMGGASSRIHVDGGTSRFDRRGIVYHAVCAGCGGFPSDFLTTEGAWSRVNKSLNCNNAAFKFDLSTLRARVITNSVQRDNPNIRMICMPDGKIVFQNYSIGGESYQWDFGDGVTKTVTDKNDIEYEYSTVGPYTVTLKAIDTQSCIGEDVDRVIIRVDTLTGYVGPDKNVCFGQQVTLEAGGGISYTWRSLAGELLALSPQFQASPEDTTSYIVSITDEQGCVLLDTLTVNVIPEVDVQPKLLAEYSCNLRTKIKFINYPTAEDEHVYIDFGDGHIATHNEEFHEYDQDGDYRVKLTTEKEFCIYEKITDISVYTLQVPNVITPRHSPGYNDTFKIMYGKNPAFKTGLNVALSVYNRWGKLVFKDAQYNNNWSAEDLKAGIYYYNLKIQDQDTCRGWLHVIK